MPRWWSRRRSSSSPSEPDFVLFSGEVPLEVVGESYRQNNLERIVVKFGREEPAILMPEPSNKHDANAVAVFVRGIQVGYLPRAVAAQYHKPIDALMKSHGRPVAFEAQIYGGEEGRPSFGIWLYHDPADLGLKDSPEPPPSTKAVPKQVRPTPTDAHGQPYQDRFNRARRAERDIFELQGLCKGFLADDELSDKEVHALHSWVDRHTDGTEDWIVAQIVRRVRKVMEDGVVSSEERADLRNTLSAFMGGTAEILLGEDPRSTGLPLDNPAPELSWRGSVFVFTGKFAFGPRADCEHATVKLGGIAEPTITKRTTYLVIGTFGSRDWMSTAYGRKIQKAAIYRERGVPLAIICEDHWRKWLT